MDKYKYNVMDIVMDYTTAGVSVEKAIKEMQEKFDTILEERGGFDDNASKMYFQSLKNLFEKH